MDQPGNRRRVLITGGTSGIGKAVAERLSRTSDVWIVGTRRETVDAALAELPGVLGSVCDVTDAAACRTAAAGAVGAFGGLDAVFINAGIDGQGVPARDIALPGFAKVLAVNVVGALAMAQAVLPVLSRPGTLVFNASMNGIRPEATYADYNSSKAAVISIAKTIALEEGPAGVSSIALCPGYFPSRMTESSMNDPKVASELLSRIPLGRFGESWEIAEVVDFLLSPGARYLNGSVVSPDGGTTI